MAIYSLDDFNLLIQSGDWIFFNVRRPRKHLDSLDWSDEELTDVLHSLKTEDFKKSVNDQIVSNLPGIETVDADTYGMHWDCEEWVRRSYAWVSGHNFPITTVELYFKIAIVPNGTGRLAGVVSFHPSNSTN